MIARLLPALGLAALIAAPPPLILPSGRHLAPAGLVRTVGVLPYASALSPDGRTLAVLDGGDRDHDLTLLSAPGLRLEQRVHLADGFEGLAWTSDGQTLLVGGGNTRAVEEVHVHAGGSPTTTRHPVPERFPGPVALSSDGKTAWLVDSGGAQVVRYGLAGASATIAFRVGPMPYAIATGPDGACYVGCWGDRTLWRIGPDGSTSHVPFGGHVTALALRPHTRALYVADGNGDAVQVRDPATLRLRSTLRFPAYPGAPPASSPGAIAFSRDGRRLYVALSDLDAVAVVDAGSGRTLGRVPTAWYPTAVSLSPDDRKLYVTCAKGEDRDPSRRHRPYSPGYEELRGTIEAIPVPDAAALARDTREVAALDGFDRQQMGWLPPIKHVVYVIRENRSFDQELGDEPDGDGDPSLVVFGRRVTPNTHTLAERYAFADQFHVEGEVSVQGHQWQLQGISSDTMERLWPVMGSELPFILENDALYESEADDLVTRCVHRHVSCRVYGFGLRDDEHGQPQRELSGLRCNAYAGWNLKVPDHVRLAAWKAEFRRGIFPAFTLMWLPEDHTAGFTPGYPTPQAMVAENDEATGQLVDILSHSPFWKDTLVVIEEDDAQGGLDHLDPHRSVLVMASPWIRPGSVSSRWYAETSVVATIDRLLHLGALTQYDARARVIDDVWTHHPDLRPFQALAPEVSLTARNPWTQEAVVHPLDLSHPDMPEGDLAWRLLAEAREARSLASR